MGATRDTTATFGEGDEPQRREPRFQPLLPCFTQVWSARDPPCNGECFVLGMTAILYLGRDRHEFDAALLHDMSPRRGRCEGGALVGDVISRKQWEIGRDEENGDALYVANIGGAPLLVNGVRVPKKTKQYIKLGDVLTIPGHYAFIVRERPEKTTYDCNYPTTHPFGDADVFGIVGESHAIWKTRERIAHAAEAGTHVLVLGETGVGKELVSRAIHKLSDRAKKPYASRNAATLGAGVFDVEVDGCAANFPNGASPERIGLIGEAGDGFLMLDEIGALSHDLQDKLLTWLDSGGRYSRCGESRVRTSNALLIAATNSPERLKLDFAKRFPTKLHLPTLAERREDIPLIARHIVLSIAAKGRGGAKRFVYEGKTKAFGRSPHEK